MNELFFYMQPYLLAPNHTGVINVVPKAKLHFVEIEENGGAKPQVICTETSDQVWWLWDPAKVKMENHPFVMEVERCIAQEGTTLLFNSCCDKCTMATQLQNQVLQRTSVQVSKVKKVGVYQYRVANCSPTETCISVCSVPSPNIQYVVISDEGYEPRTLHINVGDWVWFTWEHCQSPHNIVQVSYDGKRVAGGFVSGGLLESPSSYLAEFGSAGVYYYYSQSLYGFFGAIVVSSQVKIVPIHVKDISPKAVKASVGDVVVWLFESASCYDIQPIKEAGDDNETPFITPRRAVAKTMLTAGIQNLISPEFAEENADHSQRHTLSYRAQQISSIITDQKHDAYNVSVSRRGFLPPKVVLYLGGSVFWSWSMSKECHNILRVFGPESGTPLLAIESDGGFTSGDPVPNSSFYQTFHQPGEYWVGSEGAPGHVCCITVLGVELQTPSPWLSVDMKQILPYGFCIPVATQHDGEVVIYTTDGSFPEHVNPAIRFITNGQSIELTKPGFTFIRAIATSDHKIDSMEFVSVRVEVQHVIENMNSHEVLNESETFAVREMELNRIEQRWLDLVFHLRCYFSEPGTLCISWSTSQGSFDLIKSFLVLVNETSFCDPVSPTANSVICRGLTAGKTYNIRGVAHAVQEKTVPRSSNVVTIVCPDYTFSGGPILSLRITEYFDRVIVLWKPLNNVQLDQYCLHINGEPWKGTIYRSEPTGMLKVYLKLPTGQFYKLNVVVETNLFSQKPRSSLLSFSIPISRLHVILPSAEVRNKMIDFEVNEHLWITVNKLVLDPGESDLPTSNTDQIDQTRYLTNLYEHMSSKHKSSILQESVEYDRLNASTVKSKRHAQEAKESRLIINRFEGADDLCHDNGFGFDAQLEQHNDIVSDKTSYASKDNSNSWSTQKQEISSDRDLSASTSVRTKQQTNSNVDPSKLSILEKKIVDFSCDETETKHEAKPTARMCCNVVHASTHSVTVSWLAPTLPLNHKVVGYIVEVTGTRFMGGIASNMTFAKTLTHYGKLLQGTKHCFICPSECFSTEVSHLMVSETYDFAVCVSVENDSSQYTIDGQIETYTTYGPPQSPVLSVISVGIREVTVEWKTRGCHKSVPLKGYLLRVQPNNEEEAIQLNAEQAVVRDLNPGMKYILSLKLLTKDCDIGHSFDSNQVTVFCPNVPEQPLYLESRVATKSYEIDIFWPPVFLDTTTYGVLSYNVFVGGDFVYNVKQSENLRYLLCNADPDLVYDVAVSTIVGWDLTDMAKSCFEVVCQTESRLDMSWPFVCIRTPVSPIPQLFNMDRDLVEVFWSEGQEYGDAVISAYQLVVNGNIYGPKLDKDVLHTALYGLKHRERYTIQVKALTEHQIGYKNEEKYGNCEAGPELTFMYGYFVQEPLIVTVSDVCGHSATIKWSLKQGEVDTTVMPDDIFLVYYPSNDEYEAKTVCCTDKTVILDSLYAGIEYIVCVQTRKVIQNTGRMYTTFSNSNTLTFTTAVPPNPPANLRLHDSTCSSLHIVWDKVPDTYCQIIAYRIFVSSESINYSSWEDLSSTQTEAVVQNLLEATEYSVQVVSITEEYMHLISHEEDTVPENLDLASFPVNLWLPRKEIFVQTSGTIAASGLAALVRLQTELSISWTPAITTGENQHLGTTLSWRRIDQARPEYSERGHLELSAGADRCTLSNLKSGCAYVLTISAIVNAKVYLDSDSKHSSKFQKVIVDSKPSTFLTAPNMEPLCLMVDRYGERSLTLRWFRAQTMSFYEEDGLGMQYTQWRLKCYHLLKNGHKLQTIKPTETEATIRIHDIVGTNQFRVSALLLPEIGQPRGETDRSYPIEKIVSNDVTVSEGSFHCFKTFGCEVKKVSSGHTIVVQWHASFPYTLSHYILAYKSCELDKQIRIPKEDALAEICVNSQRTIVSLYLEAVFLDTAMTVKCCPIDAVIPGDLLPPTVWIGACGADYFQVCWEMMPTYGVTVKAFEIYVGKRKAAVIQPQHRKIRLTAQSQKAYKVQLKALSSNPEYGDSKTSAECVYSSGSALKQHLDALQSECNTNLPLQVTTNDGHLVRFVWPKIPKPVQKELDHIVIMWSSQNDPRRHEETVSKAGDTFEMKNTKPGELYFVRLLLMGRNGTVLHQSNEIEVETSAPISQPILTAKATNPKYIALSWEKPKEYGEAKISGYTVFINGVATTTCAADSIEYTVVGGKWCEEYCFTVQALSFDKNFNSPISNSVMINWPGVIAPALHHQYTSSVHEVSLTWTDPVSSGSVVVAGFYVTLKENSDSGGSGAGSTKPYSKTIGLLHSSTRAANFSSVPQTECGFVAVIKVAIVGFEELAESDNLLVLPGVAPQPPVLKAVLVDLAERQSLESSAADLIHRRDRLYHAVNTRMHSCPYGFCDFDYNYETHILADTLHKVEQYETEVLNKLRGYTDDVKVGLSWKIPAATGTTQATRVKIFIDDKQHGPEISSEISQSMITLKANIKPHRLSLRSCTDYPSMTSAPSNTMYVQTEQFLPFLFFCLHNIHKKESVFPHSGCCSYESTWLHEVHTTAPISLCPGAESSATHFPSIAGYSLQTDCLEPILIFADTTTETTRTLLSRKSQRPYMIIVWTPWCKASQKEQKLVTEFVKKFPEHFSVIFCAYDPEDTLNLTGKETAAKSLKEYLSEKATVSGDISHFVIDKRVCDCLKVFGVPTFLFVLPSGALVWQGRIFAGNIKDLEKHLLHIYAKLYHTPCPTRDCAFCEPIVSATSNFQKTFAPTTYGLPSIKRPLEVNPIYPPLPFMPQFYDPWLARMNMIGPGRMIQRRQLPWYANVPSSRSQLLRAKRALSKHGNDSDSAQNTSSLNQGDTSYEGYASSSSHRSERIPWYRPRVTELSRTHRRRRF